MRTFFLVVTAFWCGVQFTTLRPSANPDDALWWLLANVAVLVYWLFRPEFAVERRGPVPASGVCSCGSDDLHIAADNNGEFVECCGCGKEYAGTSDDVRTVERQWPANPIAAFRSIYESLNEHGRRELATVARSYDDWPT